MDHDGQSGWASLRISQHRAGPLKHPVSRFRVARSLNAAAYVSFRDVESQLLAREVSFEGTSSLYPDWRVRSANRANTRRGTRKL